MYYGAAYYPEHWPRERWETDAKMMQEAGINTVRIGEFAWSLIEPEPGKIDFTMLDDALNLLDSYGVKTLMCTLSRTPPPWFYEKYPDSPNVNENGRQRGPGHRYAICHNHPGFIKESKRIDKLVIEHYAGNRAIAGWHIDNEIGSGNSCYCNTCRKTFQKHLKEKYKTIDNLHQKWGTHFWAFSFSSFSEIPLPNNGNGANPALFLEYKRFLYKVNVDFAMHRYSLMKKNDPDKWVTTNFQQSRPDHTDIFDLSKALDINGTNFYPNGAHEFGLDWTRGTRGKVLILEQRSGAPHWQEETEPGMMRLWAWRSIAPGACGINFFRWRPCRWGQEEYWHGILPHSGRKTRRYDECVRMGQELKKLSPVIEKTSPASDTAIIMGYESRWAMDAVIAGRNAGHLSVLSEAYKIHEVLMQKNLSVDAFDPHEDLSKYKLVIAPRMYLVDENIKNNLTSFVENGGILCLTAKSGTVDECNTIVNAPLPGLLSEIAGISFDHYGALSKDIKLKGNSGVLKSQDLCASHWADEIICTTAEVIAEYEEGWHTGIPAITCNSFGKGKVVYLGTVLKEDSLDVFISWLMELAAVKSILETPEGVHAYRRTCEEYALTFVINYSDEVKKINLDSEYENAATCEKVKHISVEPKDLVILKR
jgi:beta-galactosidase